MKQVKVAIDGFGRMNKLLLKDTIVIEGDSIDIFVGAERIANDIAKVAKEAREFVSSFILPPVSEIKYEKINTRELDFLSESFTDSYFRSHHTLDYLSTNVCKGLKTIPSRDRFGIIITGSFKVLIHDDIETNLHQTLENELFFSIPPFTKNDVSGNFRYLTELDRFEQLKEELKIIKKVSRIRRSQVKNMFKRILKGIKNRVKIPQVQNFIAQIVPPRLFHNYIDDTDNNRVAINNFSFSCSCI